MFNHLVIHWKLSINHYEKHSNKNVKIRNFKRKKATAVKKVTNKAFNIGRCGSTVTAIFYNIISIEVINSTKNIWDTFKITIGTI